MRAPHKWWSYDFLAAWEIRRLRQFWTGLGGDGQAGLGVCAGLAFGTNGWCCQARTGVALAKYRASAQVPGGGGVMTSRSGFGPSTPHGLFQSPGVEVLSLRAPPETDSGSLV